MSSQQLDGIVGCSISAILDMQIFTMPTEFTAAYGLCLTANVLVVQTTTSPTVQAEFF